MTEAGLCAIIAVAHVFNYCCRGAGSNSCAYPLVQNEARMYV